MVLKHIRLVHNNLHSHFREVSGCWRQTFSPGQFLPVDILEEWVRLYLCETIFATQSLLWVFVQKACQQIFADTRDADFVTWWEFNFVILNVLKQVLFVFVIDEQLTIHGVSAFVF